MGLLIWGSWDALEGVETAGEFTMFFLGLLMEAMGVLGACKR